MKNKDGKVTKLFYLVYSLPVVGYGLVVALLGYVSYFAMNVLGLPALLVGNLILASKIFDGVTDIIGGFIIDHTHTRFGKARPYDWAYVGFCLAALMFFCIPRMERVATAICVFLIYKLIYSVFQTLYSCAQAVYLVRTVSDPEQQVKVNVVSMLVGTICAIIAGIMIPLAIANAGTDPAVWRMFAFAICIPSAIICAVRFFIIKENEITEEQKKAEESIPFREGIALLAKNKYVLIIALALLVTNIATNLVAVNPFYFEHVVGDISQQGIVNALAAVGPLSIIFFPTLSKKLGKKRFISFALILGIIGKLLPLLAPKSIVLLSVGGALGTLGYMPIYVLAVNMIIDCMDYGQWKFGKRGEAIYSCISGFCSKVGTGLGNWVVGFGMMLGGFISGAVSQSEAAVSSIIILYTVVPAAMYLIAAVTMHFYKVDDLLPQIREALGKIRKWKQCDI